MRTLLLACGAVLVVCTGLAAAPAQPGPRDDWPAAAAVESAADEAALRRLTADVRSGRYGNIHSLVALRHGRLVYEEYFTGADERRGTPIGTIAFGPDTRHDARSVTKSVVSILLGLAVRDGAITSLDRPVLDYFPEHADLRTPERLAIRLRHLLSMTSGLAWDEETRPYGDPGNDETAMDAAADPFRYVLSRPIAAPPTERFEYSGGDTMLLAGVIERATRMRLQEYAERVLFGALGIRDAEWLTYPNGLAIAASGLRLRPRDMARIGQLYLDGGRWRGAPLVPADWVRESMARQMHVSDRPLGLQAYGYQWWIGTGRLGETPLPYALAVGWGGQRIMIVPSQGVVMVITAGLYGDRRQTDITFEILLDRLLPALVAESSESPAPPPAGASRPE